MNFLNSYSKAFESLVKFFSVAFFLFNVIFTSNMIAIFLLFISFVVAFAGPISDYLNKEGKK